MKKSKATRITERSFERGRLRLGNDGRYRCTRHNKLFYPTKETAHDGLVEHARNPQMDPGAVAYGCDFSAGFHIGHPGGWKSLQRCLELAGVAS